MKRSKIYIYCSLIILILFGWVLADSNKKNEDFTETVKVALREVGNQLLLSNKDASSLVLPIIELESNKFQLSFQKELSFEPTSFVAVIKEVFQKANLPNHYRVEVLQCSDNEVAYSFVVKNQSEKDIIPCAGRFLPNKCYSIEVKFTNNLTSFFSKQVLLLLLLFIILIFFLDYKLSYRKNVEQQIKSDGTHTKIGVFQFYPEQNKLVKKATEINLSKKECELLAIFVANLNQIIKREELMKKVWEDNGVFVGRSLDTYISKLRKKLKDDQSIKITNVHGVGYKLEIN